MTYQNILFDLDGTITDPKEGITKSVQYALAKLGIYEKNLEALTSFIGPPLAQSFRELYAFGESDARQAVEYYREYFKETGIFQNALFGGMVDLLAGLQRQGRSLILATSKPTVFARRILEHFRIEKYFAEVHGSELDGTRSDKTELIAYIMQQHKLDKSETVMVGDRKHDIIGARNNGISSIGVTFGYGSLEELTGAGPTTVCRSVDELKKTLLLRGSNQATVAEVRAIGIRDSETVDRLTAVWHSSVAATHDFLTAEEIRSIEPEVRQGLQLIEHLYGYYDEDGQPLGFVGMQDDKIEMLFVEAKQRGRGIGKKLLEAALKHEGVRYVDVNEQNGQGCAFYANRGFRIVGRSELDSQGRPYPILHLEI
jgi:phosphoglycolate phosphatase